MFTCKRRLANFGTVLLLVLLAATARAATFQVTIGSAALDGLDGLYAFDFIDGGPPTNFVTLSPLVSDGTPSGASTSGDVSGTGPWTFGDSELFNELLFAYAPFGSSLSFSFTSTDNPADPGFFPDAFALFALENDALTSLISSDDPTGANALFRYDTGVGVTLFTPIESGYSITVTRTDLPEPGTLMLVVAGLLVAIVRRRPAPEYQTGRR